MIEDFPYSLYKQFCVRCTMLRLWILFNVHKTKNNLFVFTIQGISSFIFMYVRVHHVQMIFIPIRMDLQKKRETLFA